MVPDSADRIKQTQDTVDSRYAHIQYVACEIGHSSNRLHAAYETLTSSVGLNKWSVQSLVASFHRL